MANVKDKIKLFEEKNIETSVSDVSKKSYGAIPKDKTSCGIQDKYEVKPHLQGGRKSAEMEESILKLPRFLSEVDLTFNSRQKDNFADLNLEETRKPFLITNRQNVKETSTEEILVMEKLRKERIEELRVINVEADLLGLNELGFQQQMHLVHQEERIYENVRYKSTKHNKSLLEDQWKRTNNEDNFKIIIAERWDSDEDEGAPSEKEHHLIEEMINTEEKYIFDLEKIIKHYIPYLNKIQLPGHLAGKQNVLFGNIAEIYTESKKFLAALNTCGYDHERIAETFLKFEILFQLYPLYSKNKPNADRYLREFQTYASWKQQQLGERLDLRSYLLTPIQRLGKYILFLKGISDQLNKRHSHSTTVQAALDLVKETMSRANDYVAIASIRHCPVNLNNAGALVMRAQFLMRTNKIVENFESMVFFFEEVIVFTIEIFKEKEVFSYIDSIKMTNLVLPPTPQNEPLTIKLEDYSRIKPSFSTPNNEQCVIILTASSVTIKETWKGNILKRLWEQAKKYKDEVNAQGSNDKLMMELQQRMRGIERAKTMSECMRKPKRF